jgi:hypothetical protein
MAYSFSAARRLTGVLPLVLLAASFAAPARAADALYFTLQAAGTLPPAPTSLLLQSPSFINVPAGTQLSVHLMRGEQVVATSRMVFNAAYSNISLIPSVPIATFVPTGTPVAPGQPLPGADLAGGTADLAAIAADPAQYKVLWHLSDGTMGTPGRVVMTGAPVGFVELKLAAISAAARLGDQKPGSVIFFPRYFSDLYNTARDNTTLTVTNTSPGDAAYVRVFFVAAADCSVVEVAFCLPAQQSRALRMSDYDPGTKGYAVAVATNAGGQPMQFNWLIGQAQTRLTSAANGGLYDVTLPALALAKRSGGAVAAAGSAAEMAFDDLMYDRLPSQIAADNVPSQAGGQNSTVLALLRPLPNLAGASLSPNATVTAYNSAGGTSAVTRPLSCFYETTLGAVRFSPTQLNTLIPADATGWLKVSAADNQPLIGAQFNSGQYAGGAPLRALAYALDYRVSVPVKAVACQ